MKLLEQFSGLRAENRPFPWPIKQKFTMVIFERLHGYALKRLMVGFTRLFLRSTVFRIEVDLDVRQQY